MNRRKKPLWNRMQRYGGNDLVEDLESWAKEELSNGDRVKAARIQKVADRKRVKQQERKIKWLESIDRF